MSKPLALAVGAYQRTGFPSAPVINCLPEAAPTKPGEPQALIARSSLEVFKTSVGDGPLRAVFFKDGLFGDDTIIVSATAVYRMTSGGALTLLTGTLAGDGLVEIDAGQDADLNPVARVATGSALYKITHDNNVTLEDFPEAGGAGASSVAYVRGYWLAVEAGTDKVFFQVPGDTTWDPLSFASAEYAPDPIVAIRIVGEVIRFLGRTTDEGWALTGSDTEPFLEPYGGLLFPIGCRSRAAAVNCQGSLIYVDNNCIVRQSDGGEPTIISDNGLSEQIRKVAAADLKASFYIRDQHPCYVLSLGASATWVYDLAARKGLLANSYGYDYWRAQLFCAAGDACYAADAISTTIYRLDPDRRDDDDTTFTMEFCAFLPAADGTVAIDNLELHCAVGGSPLAGQGSDPLVWMRMSKDQGMTWSGKRYRGLGMTGKYRTRVRWNALGSAPAPNGAIFRFGVSDPVIRRISGVWVNA